MTYRALLYTPRSYSKYMGAIQYSRQSISTVNQVKSVRFVGCPFLPLIPTSQQLRNAPSAVLKPFQYISATYTKQATMSDPQFPYSHFFCSNSQRSNLKEDKLLVAHLAKSPDTV